MTAADRITVRDDGLGGLFVYRGNQRIGWVYPKVPSDPDSPWYGKSLRPAYQCGGRLQAVAFVAGVAVAELPDLEDDRG